jgi:chorismate synthase
MSNAPEDNKISMGKWPPWMQFAYSIFEKLVIYLAPLSLAAVAYVNHLANQETNKKVEVQHDKVAEVVHKVEAQHDQVTRVSEAVKNVQAVQASIPPVVKVEVEQVPAETKDGPPGI